MTASRTLGRSCALLSLALVSCRTITVEPAGLALPRIPAERRPALAFDLRYSTDAALAYPELDGHVERFDGEDLAAETATLRDALVATQAFSSVRRGRPGRRLHCDLQVRAGFGTGTQMMSVVMTAGILPDIHSSHYELVASVTAPGRPPRTYTAKSDSETWVWLPLLPVGVCQLAFQSAPLQQAVDALVAQIAADDWLEGD